MGDWLMTDPAATDVIGERLGREFFAREPDIVAPDLIGRVLVSTRSDAAEPITLRITETEAYHGPEDPASHAYRGLTPRTAVMFGPPGFLYVYFVYGMHWCANIVTGHDGAASAVLLRAAAPLSGLAELREKRRSPAGRLPGDVELARGPARLASCLALTGSDSGADLCGDESPFTVHAGAAQRPTVRSGPRVGVAAAAETAWRFFQADEPTVSDYRRGGRARKPS